MSTGLIIAIVVVVLIALALIAVAMPRMRATARARELERHRGEVADAHREQASTRSARAEEAEQIAARERAEAELHETRAQMHERGLADDELEVERERLGEDREDRFTREGRDATIAAEDQPR
jgi:flagellar biosynthesis/type III secretory pathway M-ring protein FliF/YscJ